MREIKFRAWVTSQDKPFMAVQGEPDLETLQSFIFHYGDEQNLMQFTGCRDKDGKEIYEGDILMEPFGILCIVGWHAKMGCFSVAYTDDFGFQESALAAPDTTIPGKCKIIGNIHENPELLIA